MHYPLANTFKHSESFKAVSSNSIIVGVSIIPNNFSKDIDNQVNDLWQDAKNKDNSKQDEIVLCYNHHQVTPTGLIISTYPINYRYVYAQLTHPGLKLNLFPLGVSGIVTSNEACLIGKRSNVTEYSGFMEFVPSGSANAVNISRGFFDFEKQLLQELSEEVSLPDLAVKNIKPMGLIYDRINSVYDIGCKINVSNLVQSKSKTAPINQKNLEYTITETVHIKQIQKIRSKLIPTSQGLLELLGACG